MSVDISSKFKILPIVKLNETPPFDLASKIITEQPANIYMTSIYWQFLAQDYLFFYIQHYFHTRPHMESFCR